MMKKSDIAVIMATYNGGRFLKEQLDSLLAQTEAECDIYVSDDGSVDNTMNILSDYVSYYPDRLSIKRNEYKSGVTRNFFSALEFAGLDYKYYFFCDQDDIWDNGKLLKMTSQAGINDDLPGVVFSDLKIVDEKLNVMKDSFFKANCINPNENRLKVLALQSIVPGCAMMINRRMAEELLNTMLDQRIIMHDYWSFLIAAVYNNISYDDNALVLYRQHDGNEVGADSTSIKGIYNRMRNAHLKITQRELQIAALTDYYSKDISCSDLSLMNKFSELNGEVKLRRIQYCIKNSVFMHGAKRKIAQLLFI